MLRMSDCMQEGLCRCKQTLVVASHDRDFLNAVTTNITPQRLHSSHEH